MNHSPLKTALAYECFQDQDNSTLALPSDQKMKTGTSGRQRVQEQVMMTVKRQKSKSSQSSTLSHSNRGKRLAPARSERFLVRLGRAVGTEGSEIWGCSPRVASPPSASSLSPAAIRGRGGTWTARAREMGRCRWLARDRVGSFSPVSQETEGLGLKPWIPPLGFLFGSGVGGD